MRVDGALSVVEAGYRLEPDSSQWLQGIAEAFAPVDRNRLGFLVAQYRIHSRGFERTGLVATNKSGEAYAKMDAANSTLAPHIHQETLCETSTEFAGRKGLRWSIVEAGWASELHPLGVHDSFNVQGFDGQCGSVCIMLALPQQSTVPPRTRGVWERVAVHLGAAIRLRHLLGPKPRDAALDGSCVVFDARSGKLLHDGATPASALVRLREVARAVDRVRGPRAREDSEQALELWRGLLAGRWSLADVHDTDGRRFVIARENAPELACDLALTRRERQVVCLVGGGHSEATAAYALGVGPATLRTHLTRALRKLGLSKSSELTELVAHLGAAREGNGGSRLR